MKLYCHVVNGQVVEGPATLPVTLMDQSDFALLTQGWYNAECIRPVSFSDRYEVFLPIQYDIQQFKVVCTYTKRDKTQDELDAQNAQKQTEVETDKANRLTFASTFMQSPEYLALSAALQMEWVGYVQVVTDTVTTGLGDAIWDVEFPIQPPMTDPPPPVPDP
jgi:hypothetical protein